MAKAEQTDETTETVEPVPPPDLTPQVLASWSLSGEPVRWADTVMQPVIVAARYANTGFGDVAAVQSLLDSTFPDKGYDAADVVLAHPPTGQPSVRGQKGNDVTLKVDDDLPLGTDQVSWELGDGTVARGTTVEHTYPYNSTDATYTATSTVAVGGVLFSGTTDIAVAAADPPAPTRQETETEEDTEGPYDPAEHTVDEVLAYADEHPDEVDDIVAAEEAGKNRITLLEKLG